MSVADHKLQLGPEQAADAINRAINRSNLPASADIAAEIGVSPRQINRVRTGERRLTHKRAAQIEAACGIGDKLLHRIIDATVASVPADDRRAEPDADLPARLVAPGAIEGLSEPAPTTAVRPEPRAPQRTADEREANADDTADGARRGGRAAPRRAWLIAVAGLIAVIAAVAIIVAAGSNGADQTHRVTPAGGALYVETAGGPTDVHEDYRTLAGVQAGAIDQGETVQVRCKVRGVKVGPARNPWWYLLASPRFQGRYATGDAFYNDGTRSGDISDTPLVDKNVPDCP